METTSGNIFLERNVRSEPKHISDKKSEVKSSWVEIGLAHATDWAFSLYLHLVSLTRNRQNPHIPKAECRGQRRRVWRGETKCSPCMCHCTARGNPVPSCCMTSKSPSHAGWWRVAQNTYLGGSLCPALNTTFPSLYLLTTLLLFLSFETGHAGGSSSSLWVCTRPKASWEPHPSSPTPWRWGVLTSQRCYQQGHRWR